MQVEEHEVDRLGGEKGARDAERPGLEHAITLQFEVDAADHADPRLVVDDEHDRPLLPPGHESSLDGRCRGRTPGLLGNV